MPENLEEKINSLDKKIDAIYKSVEKTRKYFLWTLIITLALIVLPLIGLIFVIPAFLNTINLSGLGL
ncbi:MAG: hypothetical protein WCX12_01730 [Candidatus Paceibacterota bacterium]|jgi:hypothetical protein